MGHKRKKMCYEDSEQIVTISIEHPENNPQGVTVEEVEEIEMPPKQPFGVNVGQQVEDLLKASNENAKQQTQEEQVMNEEAKENVKMENNENINHKQEESKMNEETTTNENTKAPEQDIPDPNRTIEPDKPGSIIDREAASYAIRGMCYGAGVVVGMAAASYLIYGIQKLIAGDSNNKETTETLSKLI